MQDKFIAQVGLGYWGKNIFRNLYELNILRVACDLNLKLLNQYKAKFPNINFTSDFKEVLKNPEIKAVVISTPAQLHYEMAKEALLAGKDVFVEKPLALSAKEGEELVKLAEEKDKVLMVGHILQYHPAVEKLKELILNGSLGKIQYIYSNRLNIGKLRTEENVLWSFAPHDISLILMLVGEEPKGVYAWGGDYVNKGIYDTTITILEFSNDVKAHIFVSWLHPFKEQKLVIIGTQAMVVFDDTTKEKLFLYPHKINWREGKIPVANKAEYQVIPIEDREPLKVELMHFLECVLKRKKPLTDGREGLKVLRILEQAQKLLLNSPFARIFPLEDKKYFVHESAFIDENVQINEGTKIWHFTHILKGTKIGKDCVIGQNCMIGPDVTVGNRCKIQNNVSIYKGVTLEDDVFCGPSCVFTNVYNPRAFIERKHEFLPTLVKRGATIGANATIVCGITIGRYAMVGAGAVVKKDVPDYAIVAGVPARQIGWACKCGVTLKFNKNHAFCKNCHNEYELKDNTIIVIKENN